MHSIATCGPSWYSESSISTSKKRNICFTTIVDKTLLSITDLPEIYEIRTKGWSFDSIPKFGLYVPEVVGKKKLVPSVQYLFEGRSWEELKRSSSTRGPNPIASKIRVIIILPDGEVGVSVATTVAFGDRGGRMEVVGRWERRPHVQQAAMGGARAWTNGERPRGMAKERLKIEPIR